MPTYSAQPATTQGPRRMRRHNHDIGMTVDMCEGLVICAKRRSIVRDARARAGVGLSLASAWRVVLGRRTLEESLAAHVEARHQDATRTLRRTVDTTPVLSCTVMVIVYVPVRA